MTFEEAVAYVEGHTEARLTFTYGTGTRVYEYNKMEQALDALIALQRKGFPARRSLRTLYLRKPKKLSRRNRPDDD